MNVGHPSYSDPRPVLIWLFYDTILSVRGNDYVQKHLSLRSSMRLIVATYATALAVATAGAQTSVPQKELPGFQAIQQSDLRRDLTYISSDELGGRLSLWRMSGGTP